METGAASATYLRDLSGALLSRTRGTTIANYALDRLDNVTALLDDQSVVNTYAYAPYGSEIRTTGTYYNPYRYASTYQDTDTGLYQMGARYYDAKSGRFTQQDLLPSSMFEAQRYHYTSGNPVNYVDPMCLYFYPSQRPGYYYYSVSVLVS